MKISRARLYCFYIISILVLFYMISKSLKETKKIAEEFINKKIQAEKEGATIIGLFGDLGSGKTTFTQFLAKKLGIKEIITSPTFVLEKIYAIKNKKGFDKLIHIDAYRLESSQELINLGFKEISKDSKNLILIEWPERVAGALPKELIKINFKFISEFEREINML